MMRPVTLQTPEDRELEKKKAHLAALEAELAEREVDLVSLHAALHSFQVHYLRIVGTCYAELDELEAQIAEAVARWDSQNPKLYRDATEARAKAAESAAATEAVQQTKHTVSSELDEDLKKIYRDVAMRIHPDLTTNERERIRRNRVMAEANKAYQERDAAKLRTILEEWHSSPELVEGEGIGAELVRVVRKIEQVERRLADIAARIAELEQSDVYVLKEKVEAARANGQDLLAQMAEQVKLQIARAKTHLTELHAKETFR